MALYTNGTTAASKADIEVALMVYDDEQVALREATATELQATIDADSSLSDAGIVASADTVDEQWVAVTLPTDASTPMFWAAQAADIVNNSKAQFVEQRTNVLDEDGNPTGEKTGNWKIRHHKDKWVSHLERISTLL